MMNQDQQFLVRNLQNMIKYIQQETNKKVQGIQKDALRDADLGEPYTNLIYRYITFSQIS